MDSIDCPICFEHVCTGVNSVHTSCGHVFHNSCLMNNIAHNGFNCPYCRTTLATQLPNDEDDEDDEDDDDETYTLNGFEDDDDTLRAFRFFHNTLDNIPHDDEDLEDEEHFQSDTPLSETIPKPSAAFIAQKLVEQGITIETLVKSLLKDHDEYDDIEEECMRIDDDLFGRMRIIISNFEASDSL